jgi:hypothetical protein
LARSLQHSPPDRDELEAKMIPISFRDLQILIAAVVFLMGCMCIILGALVLISRGYSSEVRSIAVHTARLGQKGMAQEVTGLVNSAVELLAGINQLVRTASGIGVFLITLGCAMIVAAYWVVMQIEWSLVS